MKLQTPMPFTSLLPRSRGGLGLGNLASIVLLSAACVAAAQSNSNADQLKSDLRRLHEIRPRSGRTYSPSERDELRAILSRLNGAAADATVDLITDSLHGAKRNREVPNYAAVLPQLPALQSAMLLRIKSEADPAVKARLINCMREVKGADVLKTLVLTLDDPRPTEPGGAVLRVCDVAFDVLYSRVAQIRELGFDASSAMSDTIAPDVPIDWRDARIGKMKSGLIAKFGANLESLPPEI
jgi:hypothetical protein